MKRQIAVVLSLLFVFAGRISSAENSEPAALSGGTGQGTYSAGPFSDTINHFNGALAFQIPLVSRSGRGLGTSVALSYNSNFWRVRELRVGPDRDPIFISATRAPTDPWPDPAVGWSMHAGRMLGYPMSLREAAATLTTFSFEGPDGSEMAFRDRASGGQPCNFNFCFRGRYFDSTGGEAALFIADEPVIDQQFSAGVQLPIRANGAIVFRDGTRLRVDDGLVTRVRDRNGNVVRYTYENDQLTQIIDTLGRTIDIAYFESSSPIYAQLTTAGAGGSARITRVGRCTLEQAIRPDLQLITRGELFPGLDDTAPDEIYNPDVICSVTVPSGRRWDFSYNAWGEVARVRMPNGGVIDYEFTRSGEGFLAAAQRTEVYRRVHARKSFPDGLRMEGRVTYGDPSAAEEDGTPIPPVERRLDASGNCLGQTRHTYAFTPLDFYNAGTIIDYGYKPWMEGKETRQELLDCAGNVLQTIEYTWEQRAAVGWFSSDPADPLAPENDPRLVRIRRTLNDSGEVTTTEREYDGFNNVTREVIRDYDGSVLQDTATTYVTSLNGINYRSNPDVHLVSLPLTVAIRNGAGLVESFVEYEYDNHTGTNQSTALLARAFAPQVEATRDPRFGPSYIFRGNLTATFTGLGADRSVMTMRYDVAGNVVQALGPRPSQRTDMEYDAALHFAQATAVIRFGETPLRLIERSTYDFSTGLQLTATGANGEVTTNIYGDPDDRLLEVRRAGGQGNLTYTYSPIEAYPAWAASTEVLDASAGAAGTHTTTTFVDGFSRTIETRESDPDGEIYSSIEYDGAGRATLFSTPRRAIPAVTDGWTRKTFDVLDRPLEVITSADRLQLEDVTGTARFEYFGSSTTQIDQAGKRRRLRRDPLGRIIEVHEPSASGELELLTRYRSDARGNLLEIIQGDQRRSFAYDSLSRVVRSDHPETGATLFTYDASSNLSTTTDARGVLTTFTYDPLNRMRTVSSSGPAAIPPSATITYLYDEAALPITPPAYSRGASLGRLVAVLSSPVSATGQEQTGVFYTYDLAGRTVRQTQLLDGVYYSSSAVYDQGGRTVSFQYPSGATLTTSHRGKRAAASTLDGQVLEELLAFWPTGAVASSRFGNGIYQTAFFNPRQQQTGLWVGTEPDADDVLGVELEYGVSSGSQVELDRNNGNLGRRTIRVGSRSYLQTFEYDELNRLSLAREGGGGGGARVFAGSDDYRGDNGDGGPADQAFVDGPRQVVVHRATGNVYIADTFSSTIRRVDPAGIISTVTPDPDALGGYVPGLAIDQASGQLYAIGSGLCADVVKVDSETGAITPFAGSNCGSAGFAEDGMPALAADLGRLEGVEVDAQGNVYIAALDTSFYDPGTSRLGGGRVYKVSPDGILTIIAGAYDAQIYYGEPNGDGGPATAARTGRLFDVAVDNRNGDVYLADTSLYSVRKVDAATGLISTVIGAGTMPPVEGAIAADCYLNGTPDGIYVDESGQLYIGNEGASILRIGEDGILHVVAEEVGNCPAGMDEDHAGNLYSADWCDNVVRVIAPGNGWSESYAYDRYGNRAGEDVAPVDPFTNRFADTAFEYDAAGNILSDGPGRSYVYDAAGRMVRAEIDGTVSLYRYDGNGKRVQKDVDGVVTRFVYGTNGRLIAEYRGLDPAAPAEEYVSSAIVVRDPSGDSIRHITVDHLGSPVLVTGEGGAIIARHDYYPFGREIPGGVGGRSEDDGYFAEDLVRQRFAGYERDQETGLDFAQARYYASGEGRFTSPDPLSGAVGNPQSLNRYVYSLNNPYRYSDPSGALVQDATCRDQTQCEEQQQQAEQDEAEDPFIVNVIQIFKKDGTYMTGVPGQGMMYQGRYLRWNNEGQYWELGGDEPGDRDSQARTFSLLTDVLGVTGLIKGGVSSLGRLIFGSGDEIITLGIARGPVQAVAGELAEQAARDPRLIDFLARHGLSDDTICSRAMNPAYLIETAEGLKVAGNPKSIALVDDIYDTGKEVVASQVGPGLNFSALQSGTGYSGTVIEFRLGDALKAGGKVYRDTSSAFARSYYVTLPNNATIPVKVVGVKN